MDGQNGKDLQHRWARCAGRCAIVTFRSFSLREWQNLHSIHAVKFHHEITFGEESIFYLSMGRE
jgi:hypothetical protein